MFLISFTNPFKGNVKPPRFKKHILLSSCMVLSSNLKYVSEFQPYSSRTATNKCLRTPKPDLSIMKHSFQYSGPFLRNKLPTNVTQSATLISFKRSLKQYVMT